MVTYENLTNSSLPTSIFQNFPVLSKMWRPFERQKVAAKHFRSIVLTDGLEDTELNNILNYGTADPSTVYMINCAQDIRH